MEGARANEKRGKSQGKPGGSSGRAIGGKLIVLIFSKLTNLARHTPKKCLTV